MSCSERIARALGPLCARPGTANDVEGARGVQDYLPLRATRLPLRHRYFFSLRGGPFPPIGNTALGERCGTSQPVAKRMCITATMNGICREFLHASVPHVFIVSRNKRLSGLYRSGIDIAARLRIAQKKGRFVRIPDKERDMTKLWSSAARRWALAFAVALTGIGGNASAILLDRGPLMVYDTVLNITWTRQAGGGIGGDISRFWGGANAWAIFLDFGGFTDWRLPYASVSAGAGPITTLPIGIPCTGAGGADEVACRDNEMAYMFYYNLDGTPGQNKTGTQTAVGGQILTGISDIPDYWSGTVIDSILAWRFSFGLGLQGPGGIDGNVLMAWAVRPGDVCDAQPSLCPDTEPGPGPGPGVPEPGSLLLLALGAMGLACSRRRRH